MKSYGEEEGIIALLIAIFNNKICTPEQAFAELDRRLGDNKKGGKISIEEIADLKKAGISVKEVALIYDVKASTLYTYIYRARKSGFDI